MNISKIATLAGVSNATVSRFLNNGYVSQENREKIQKIIDETGYIPSAHAQTLRTKKTNLIGVILPKISSEAVSRIIEGTSKELTEAGYHILLGNTDLNIQKEIEYLNIFKNNQVDGIIFVATILTPAHLEVMEKIKVPIIVVGQQVEGYSCVYHDDFGAAYTLTKEFIQKGCKRIGYIGVTEKDIAVGYERKRGFMQALQDSGIEVQQELIKIGDFSEESGYQAINELMQLDKRIDGVFCATDKIAVGALEWMKEKQPEQIERIKFAGIGDSVLAKAISPKLASMHYYYKTSGKEAAKMLLDAMQSETKMIKEVKLGYELKLRESFK